MKYRKKVKNRNHMASCQLPLLKNEIPCKPRNPKNPKNHLLLFMVLVLIYKVKVMVFLKLTKYPQT
jgi:hypothetical protein